MENLFDPTYMKHVATIAGVCLMSFLTAGGVSKLWELTVNLYKH